MFLHVYVMFMLFMFQVSVLESMKGAEAQIIAKNFPTGICNNTKSVGKCK
jgi:hypothetical protein